MTPNSTADDVAFRIEKTRIRKITLDDVRASLSEGVADFKAKPSHVFFLALIYPAIGVILVYAAFGYNMVPLMFPLISGFALIGPITAVGLYGISRRRENGETPTWRHAFDVMQSSAFGPVMIVAAGLVLLFIVWVATANAIYAATLGPEAPASVGAFLSDVFGTSEGWRLILIGHAVGFVFAVVALAVSVFSLPMIVDGEANPFVAVWTSVRAVCVNPVPMAAWGLLVAAGMILGSAPALVGLVVVLPIFGHATWRLYRRTIVR
jgi:uncharacterized membrane protein